MCSIFGVEGKSIPEDKLRQRFEKTVSRGPDKSRFIEIKRDVLEALSTVVELLGTRNITAIMVVPSVSFIANLRIPVIRNTLEANTPFE